MNLISIIGIIAAIITIIAFITGRYSIWNFFNKGVRGQALDSQFVYDKPLPLIDEDPPEISPGIYTISISSSGSMGIITINSVEVETDGSFVIWVTIESCSGHLPPFFMDNKNNCLLKNTTGKQFEPVSYGGVFEGQRLLYGESQKGWVKFDAPANWRCPSAYSFKYSTDGGLTSLFPPIVFKMLPKK